MIKNIYFYHYQETELKFKRYFLINNTNLNRYNKRRIKKCLTLKFNTYHCKKQCLYLTQNIHNNVLLLIILDYDLFK